VLVLIEVFIIPSKYLSVDHDHCLNSFMVITMQTAVGYQNISCTYLTVHNGKKNSSSTRFRLGYILNYLFGTSTGCPFY
jgi:hypothetical protein